MRRDRPPPPASSVPAAAGRLLARAATGRLLPRAAAAAGLLLAISAVPAYAARPAAAPPPAKSPAVAAGPAPAPTTVTRAPAAPAAPPAAPVPLGPDPSAQTTSLSGPGPLVANGLGSPSCRDPRLRAQLSATARTNCGASGVAVAVAPLEHYEFDVHIDSGILGFAPAAVIPDLVIGPVWMAIVWLTHVAVVALEWCFSLDLLGSGALAPVARGLQAMRDALTTPWLGPVLAIAAVAVLYNGIVRRRVVDTLGQVALLLAMMAGGLWVIADPTGTVGAASRLVNEASLGALGAAATGDPSHPVRSLDDALGALFDVSVTGPWCYLEFGDVGWCRDSSALDPGLLAAARQVVARDRADATSATRRRAVQVEAGEVAAARTNGDLFLALPANGPRRNSINADATNPSLLRTLCGGDTATSCPAATGPQAEFRTQKGTAARIGGLVLIVIGAAGMFALVGFICLRLLGAALLALLYLLLAPVAVLAPALGDAGRDVFRRWSLRLLGAVLAKLVYSVFLGVVLLMVRILSTLGGLGWWTQWLLFAVFWWLVFNNRHRVLENVIHERAESTRRASLANRLFATRQALKLAAPPAKLLRKTAGRAGERLRRLPGRVLDQPLRRPGFDPSTTLARQVAGTLERDHDRAVATLARAPTLELELGELRARRDRLQRERRVARTAGDRRRTVSLLRREHDVENADRGRGAPARRGPGRGAGRGGAAPADRPGPRRRAANPPGRASRPGGRASSAGRPGQRQTPWPPRLPRPRPDGRPRAGRLRAPGRRRPAASRARDRPDARTPPVPHPPADRAPPDRTEGAGAARRSTTASPSGEPPGAPVRSPSVARRDRHRSRSAPRGGSEPPAAGVRSARPGAPARPAGSVSPGRLHPVALAGGLIAGFLGLAVLVAAVEVVDEAARGSSSCAAGPTTVSATGLEQIPARLIPVYQQAAGAYGLGPDGWAWLAAVNRIETDFGRDTATSSAGAVGWMQFEPATWAEYGVDGDGDGRKDPYDPADAIGAAARYLRALGAPTDWQRAIRSYNGGPANARSASTLGYWAAAARDAAAYLGAGGAPPATATPGSAGCEPCPAAAFPAAPDPLAAYDPVGVPDARGGYGFTPAPGAVYAVGQEPEIARRLDALGRALGLRLTGLSGYRTPAHSRAVGGYPDDPHTRGQASDTPGVEAVSEATLERFGLTRPSTRSSPAVVTPTRPRPITSSCSGAAHTRRDAERDGGACDLRLRRRRRRPPRPGRPRPHRARRPGHRPGRSAPGGPGDDRRRQPADRDALRLRRRPRRLPAGPRLRLLERRQLGSPRRRLPHRPRGLGHPRGVRRPRRRPLGHRLRQPGARVRLRRRHPPRHEPPGRRRALRAVRPALAPGHTLDRRLRRPPPAGVVSRRRLLAGLAACALATGLALPGRPPPGRRPPAPVVVTGSSPTPARPPASRPGPRAVSRAFVAAYVGFVYRRLTAAQIPAASPDVRRRIAGLRPDPAPAVLAAADPRLRSLSVARHDRASAVVVVAVEDRASVYALTLDLRRLPSGWTVVGLTETG